MLRLSDVLQRARPDPECPICGGLGFNKAESASVGMCECRVRLGALEYCTPLYASGTFRKNMNPDPFDRDLRLDASDLRWKNHVKSFLLATAGKYTHFTATGQEIIQAFVTEGRELFDAYKHCGLFIMYLHTDPRNKEYGNVLGSIIRDRQLHGLPTWVVSDWDPDSQLFRDKYSMEFSTLIKKAFAPVALR